MAILFMITVLGFIFVHYILYRLYKREEYMELLCMALLVFTMDFIAFPIITITLLSLYFYRDDKERKRKSREYFEYWGTYD